MAAFDWTTYFGDKPLLKKTGPVSVKSLSDKDIVGIYFSAHWCPPCRGFTPILSKAYENLAEGTTCEIVFISSDSDIDSFTEYHAEMPFAAVEYENARTCAANDLSGRGIPFLVFCDGKTGKVLTKEGRSLVQKFQGKFAFEATKIVENKKLAATQVKDMSILGEQVIDNQGNDVDFRSADVIAVAFGSPTNRGWQEFVRPKLIEAHKQANSAGNKFVVVYHSDSESEDKSKIHTGWGILPHGTSSGLFNALGNTDAPTVMIFKKKDTGEFGVVVEDAARAIYESPDAFPWTANAIAAAKKRQQELLIAQREQMKDFQLFKKNDNFVGGDGKGAKIPFEKIMSSVGSDGVIGLYFSAHWCGPCRHFTPKLAKLYQECQEAGKKFEILFVSSDSNQEAFDEYFGEMPWKALAYSARDLKSSLSEMYEVEGIPTLVLLKSDGSEITRSGRQIVSVGAEFFPWGPEDIRRGKQVEQERAKERAALALKKEETDIAAAKADGAVVLRRFHGEPGGSPIERKTGSQYAISFEAFDTFATPGLASSGILYYEVHCVNVSRGVAQIGFADAEFKASTHDGVGDDSHSWGFDGNRVCKWGDGKSTKYGRAWKNGDVVGCSANLDEKTISFFLNGESMGVAFTDIKVSGELRIAVTAQGDSYKLLVDAKPATK